MKGEPSLVHTSFVPEFVFITPVLPVVPIQISHSMLFAPTATGLRHLLLDAAILQEFLLILLQQSPEQKISLVDKNECNVSQSDVVAQFADAHIVGRGRVLFAPSAGILALLAVDIPHLIAVIAQIVFIVLLQLFKARLCHVHQLDACFH